MSGRKNNLKSVFGQVLREYREKADFSQEHLALECGLDRTYISLLERGLRQPTMESLFAISKALDTKPSKLISAVEKSM